MNTNYWFIGGPKHLEFMALREPLPVVKCLSAPTQPIPACEDLASLSAEPRSFRIVIYHREIWTTGKNDIVVYISETIDRKTEARLAAQLASLPIPEKVLLKTAGMTEKRLPAWISNGRYPLAIRLEVEWAHVCYRLLVLHRNWMTRAGK